MRILFTRFPLESRYGGAEVQTMSLIQGLLDRGHAAAFLGSCPTLLHLCAEEGLPAAQLLIGPPPVSMWHALSFSWRKKRMRQGLEGALREFGELDAICMMSLSEKLLLTPFALTKGLRVIWIEHDRVGRWLTKNPWLSQLLTLSKNVTTVVVSELSKKIYVNLGWSPENVVVIPNGVDERRLAVSGKRLAVSETLRVGSLARLSEDKGVDLLVEAVADIPEADLTIVGDGPEEGYLRKLIAEATPRDGLSEPRMRIVRRVDDLGTFYQGLDVFVLPSREHDPFGLAAAEAMLCGTPVIVTNACGIAGYLQHREDAWIIPANDRRALVEAIFGMCDPAIRKRLAVSGERVAREKFSLQTMTDTYERVLRSA